MNINKLFWFLLGFIAFWFVYDITFAVIRWTQGKSPTTLIICAIIQLICFGIVLSCQPKRE